MVGFDVTFIDNLYSLSRDLCILLHPISLSGFRSEIYATLTAIITLLPHMQDSILQHNFETCVRICPKPGR
jgi:hypothetical protein